MPVALTYKVRVFARTESLQVVNIHECFHQINLRHLHLQDPGVVHGYAILLDIGLFRGIQVASAADLIVVGLVEQVGSDPLVHVPTWLTTYISQQSVQVRTQSTPEATLDRHRSRSPPSRRYGKNS